MAITKNLVNIGNADISGTLTATTIKKRNGTNKQILLADGTTKDMGSDTTTFLRNDGEWAIPSGTGPGTNTTYSFTGSAPITVSTSGSNPVTVTITHTTSGVTTGSYGSSTQVPVISVNATGHITSATIATITNTTSVTVSLKGSGNAIASITASGGLITATLGSYATLNTTSVTVSLKGSGNAIATMSASGGLITATLGTFSTLNTTSVTVSIKGTGNAIATMSASGGAITATLGSYATTAHSKLADTTLSCKLLVSTTNGAYEWRDKITENGVGDWHGTAGSATTSGTTKYSATLWRANLPDVSLYDGLTIFYKVPVAGQGTSGTLLRIDSDDTSDVDTLLTSDASTKYYPVCTNTNSMISTRYPVGSIVALTFDSLQTGQYVYWRAAAAATASRYISSENGTGLEKPGCWKAVSDYDSNTNTIGYQLRYNSTVRTVTDRARYYKIYFTSADGTQWVPASSNWTNDATTARAVNTRPIDPFGEIVYTSATTNYTEGSNLAATTIWQQYNITLGYSFNPNGGTLALTNKLPVYVLCTPLANGSAIIDATTPIVQALPTTDDGKIYIYLGTATAATTMELSMKHPVYYYKDGSLRIWTNNATTASDEKVKQEAGTGNMAFPVLTAPTTISTGTQTTSSYYQTGLRVNPSNKSVIIGGGDGLLITEQGKIGQLVFGNTVINSSIYANGNGAMAHGFVEGENSYIETDGNGAVAHGYVSGANNNIKANNSGAVAHGYVAGINSHIEANGDGAFAFGGIWGTGSRVYSDGEGSLAFGNTDADDAEINAGGDGAISFGTINGDHGFIYASEEGSFAGGVINGTGTNSCIYALKKGSFAFGYISNANEATLTTADGAIAIGTGITSNQQNLMAIGKYNALGSDGDLFIVGNGTSTASRSNAMAVNNLGIVTVSNKVNAVNGFFQTSDERQKNIISDLSLDKVYDLIDKCQTIIYTLKDDESNKKQIGMIAQEIQEFFPEVISEDKDGMLSLDYSRLTVIIFKVLKDLIKRISKIEQKIN